MGKRVKNKFKKRFSDVTDVRIGGYLQSVSEERPARVVMGISIL
jgi:hypothetical protein